MPLRILHSPVTTNLCVEMPGKRLVRPEAEPWPPHPPIWLRRRPSEVVV